MAAILYLPSFEVDAPTAVPFTLILTPGSGSPLASVTVPVTLIVCALVTSPPHSISINSIIDLHHSSPLPNTLRLQEIVLVKFLFISDIFGLTLKPNTIHYATS
ncbi:hypothetical protein D3C87_1874390 [compost metagenome]